MQIALVNHTFRSTDGQGHVNASLARGLLAYGHEVTLVGSDAPEDVASHPAASVTPLRPAPLPAKLLRDLSFGGRTAKAIRRLRSNHDAVIANGGMSFASVDINLCHFVHAAWLQSPHHPRHSASHVSGPRAWYQYAYSKQSQVWESNAYRRAAHVVAVSEEIKRQLVEEVGVESRKVTVIENGIDPPAVSDRGEARLRMGVSDDRFVALFVGDLKTPRKNFDVLIDALRLLPTDVVVVAVGSHQDGPYTQLASNRGVSDRVHFLGHRSDVRELYAGADAFVLMSHYEPFGLVVTEAMAAGLPVVTARAVGAASVVERHDAGTLIENPNDANAVAAALRELLDQPELRQLRGLRAREVTDDLGWGRVAEKYVRLLDSMILDPKP